MILIHYYNYCCILANGLTLCKIKIIPKWHLTEKWAIPAMVVGVAKP